MRAACRRLQSKRGTSPYSAGTRSTPMRAAHVTRPLQRGSTAGTGTRCRAFLRLEQKPGCLLHVAAGDADSVDDRRRRRRREGLRELHGLRQCGPG